LPTPPLSTRLDLSLLAPCRHTAPSFGCVHRAWLTVECVVWLCECCDGLAVLWVRWRRGGCLCVVVEGDGRGGCLCVCVRVCEPERTLSTSTVLIRVTIPSHAVPSVDQLLWLMRSGTTTTNDGALRSSGLRGAWTRPPASSTSASGLHSSTRHAPRKRARDTVMAPPPRCISAHLARLLLRRRSRLPLPALCRRQHTRCFVFFLCSTLSLLCTRLLAIPHRLAVASLHIPWFHPPAHPPAPTFVCRSPGIHANSPLAVCVCVCRRGASGARSHGHTARRVQSGLSSGSTSQHAQ
jgi:hypothetical protein